jgi:tetratricopeptide (TPR) repeat protein
VRELLGLAYYHLGRWREAARELAAYRRLSGERDQDPPYADAERALGRPEKAVEILSDLERDEVSEEVWVEALIVKAGALRELDRAKHAVDELRRGPLRPEPVLQHHLRLWYALAEALEDAGERAEARSWWDAIYAEDPEFFDVARRRLGLKR